MDENCDEISVEELRKRAMYYYGSDGGGDGVTDKMEVILNNMFYEQPKDIYGYLVYFFDLFLNSSVLNNCAFTLLGDMYYC